MLLAAFQSERADLALEGGRGLWRLGQKAESIVPALLTVAQGPLVKSIPARNLLASFGPWIVPILAKTLTDAEATRHEAAVDILGRIGPRPARPFLPFWPLSRTNPRRSR